jgi:hypothetical protein
MMSGEPKCDCAQCRWRSAMFPAALITLGVLILVGEYGPYSLAELWPILLIVIGAVKVAEAVVSSEGHVGS